MRLFVAPAIMAAAALLSAVVCGVPVRDAGAGLLIATALLLGREPRRPR